MASDDISFNLVVNTGNSDANIRAVNSALSDFSRVTLRAETNAKSAGTALERWLRNSANAAKSSTSNLDGFSRSLDISASKAATAARKYKELDSSLKKFSQTRRAQTDASGNIVTSGGYRTSTTVNQRARVTRPAGPADAGSGFSVQRTMVSSLKELDAQYRTNDEALRQLNSTTQKATILTEGYYNSSASLRYALYDVSNSAALASAAFAAFPILAAKGAIDAELAFANVQRTTGIAGQAAQDLKNQFLELSQAMPASFGEISGVGTLAGQLGVANDQLEAFTKNTIEFATVSNMTSEESATAFARLNQLLPGVQGNYEALGSAILKVGTDSAATESEIVAVAQQIAPVASAFNISAANVIGFSGALASLKVPPELSRGMLQRTFAEVNAAISSNSSQLEEWGRTIGVSGEEFKKAWLGDSMKTFTDVLRAIGNQGGAAEGTLVRLGITSSRDAATIKRLAQNVDGTLVPALENANSAYSSADEQQRQFDKIAQTLSKRLEVLANNFNNLLMVAGNGVSAFGGLLDVAAGFLGWITDILNTPFGKWFALITGTAASFMAILLAIVAVGARVRAGLLAIDMAVTGLRNAFAEARAQAAMTGESIKGLGVAANATGISLRTLKVALISTGIGIAVTVIGSLVASLVELGAASNDARSNAELMYGSFDDLRSAMEQDAKAMENGTAGIISYSDWLKRAGKRVDESGRVIDDESVKRAENVDVINAQAGALDKYGAAIGKATRQKIADAFIGSEQFKQIDKWNQKMAELGMTEYQIDLNKVLTFVSTGDNQGLKNYLDGVKGQVTASIQSWDTSSLGAMFDPGAIFGETTAQVAAQAFDAALSGAEASMTALGIAGAGTASQIDGFVNGTGIASTSTDAWSQSLDDVIAGLDEIRAQAEKGFTYTNAIDDAVSSYQDLMDALSASGGSLSMSFEDGRAAASAFQSSVVDMIALGQSMGISAAESVNIVYMNMMQSGANAADVQLQLNGLVQAGIISLAQMQQIIGGTFKMSTGGQELANAFSGIKASAGGAAKQVRTLIDYANDLSSVWKRAFDIRFDAQSQLDEITKSWRDMAEATQDAKNEINDLKNSIAELTADKALKEYFLSVAEAYGDTIRAAQLRADIAKIDGDLSDASRDLTKAQGRANKTLIGNSDAAIENRNQITGLVQRYQSYIQSLAASGASQEQLMAATNQARDDFYRQAEALGYNRSQLSLYAAAFDDVSTAISNVPRNVTVTANTNPALQALNEFTAKAKSAGAAAGSAWNSAFDAYVAKTGRGAQIQSQITTLQGDLENLRARGIGGLTRDRIADQILVLSRILASGNYATGGYVSGPGGPTSDSIVARISNGEYVMRAAAVNKYGVGFFDNLNQMRSPRFASGGYVQPAPQMVMLSPEDRALLRGAGGSGEVVLYANNEAIARSANAGNRSIVAAGGRP